MKALGIEIGGTKLQLVLANEEGRILQRRSQQVALSNGAAGIRAQIARTLPDLVGHDSIDAVGVGFGGPVDWHTGKICCSHQVAGWSDFDLSDWLGRLTGVRVAVDNDANVAALGEAVRGAGAGMDPVFYVTLGSGVGGGLVSAAKIFHGAKPGESEIGHIRLDRAGTTVESRCSGWAVDARIRELKVTEPASLLARLAADLALGLSHVVHLFHPQVIVMGGGLSRVGEPLRAAVGRALQACIMTAFAPGPKLLLSQLGEDAVPLGAVCLTGIWAKG